MRLMITRRAKCLCQEVMVALKGNMFIAARAAHSGQRHSWALLRRIINAWKGDWLDTTLIRKGLRKHAIRLKTNVLYGWHEAVKQHIITSQQRDNLKKRHERVLCRRVLVAWSWRRELSRMALVRSARQAVRLQHGYFRWWGEVIVYQKRVKRMFALCFQFQSRKGSTLLYSCLLSWHALAAEVRVKAKMFAKVMRQWLSFTMAKAFHSWTHATNDERVSRQVCSRTVHIGGRKLLRSSLTTWKEVWALSSANRNCTRRCSVRLRTRMLRKWHEVVRSARYWLLGP